MENDDSMYNPDMKLQMMHQQYGLVKIGKESKDL